MTGFNKLIKTATCMAAFVAGGAAAQAQSFDWSGFYAGVHIDGSMFSVESSDLTDTFTNDAPSQSDWVFGGGLTAGYNYQLSENVILGAEFSYTSEMRNDQFLAFNSSGSQGLEFYNGWDDILSLSGRVGLVQDRALFFVSGGVAMASANYSVRNVQPSNNNCGDSICAEFDDSILGIVVGGGAEYAFTENVIGKFEVLLYNMESTESPVENSGAPSCGAALGDECTVSTNSTATSIRFGVNYKF